MKLAMDGDETTAGSERSESSSVRTRSSRSSGLPYSSGEDEGICVRNGSSHSSGVPYSSGEDESSASSVTGSDVCPPYEEIPTSTNRYSCSSLPSPPPCARSLHSFRDIMLSSSQSSSPTELYSNEPAPTPRRCSSSSLYSNTDVTRHRLSRPSSVYSNCEQNYVNTSSPIYSNTPESVVTDVNDNQTVKERLSDGSLNGVTEAEKHQIEIFFRGLRTEVWVSSCLANMYVSQKGQEGKWDKRHTGVPVLILESGDTKSRSKRRIQIILAERGTSFPLWKDTIDNLSAYRKANHAFHTMCLSTDHRQVVGLSFDCEEESNKLLKQIELLTADPENINISVPKKKKKLVKAKKPAPLPQKKHISNPCLFEHVTSIAARDNPVYESLQTLVSKGMEKNTENTA